MKKDLVELVFILDRSGSMRGLEEDTIGGFNSMIDEQKQLDGEVIVSTVLFNQTSTVIHDRVNIHDIKEMNHQDYRVSGSTALLDAVGRSIRFIKRKYGDTLRENRPSKVIFMITTDGMENASREFSYERLKRDIDRVKEEYDWEFLFIGANMDSVKEASRIGISRDRAVRYMNDEQGTRTNYRVLNKAMSNLRMHQELNEDWKKEIEEDYKKRSQK